MSITTSAARDNAIVIASHLPGEGHYQSDLYRVDAALCVDEFDYWRAIEKHWSSDLTIVNVEHDIELYDEQVSELLACSHGLCTYAYACHWSSTHQPRDIFACGNGSRLTQCTYHQGGEEWAEWSAIGLIKITPEARVAPLRQEPWPVVELAIEDAVKRPWHVHWGESGRGVEHHHW